MTNPKTDTSINTLYHGNFFHNLTLPKDFSPFRFPIKLRIINSIFAESSSKNRLLKVGRHCPMAFDQTFNQRFKENGTMMYNAYNTKLGAPLGNEKMRSHLGLVEHGRAIERPMILSHARRLRRSSGRRRTPGQLEAKAKRR